MSVSMHERRIVAAGLPVAAFVKMPPVRCLQHTPFRRFHKRRDTVRFLLVALLLLTWTEDVAADWEYWGYVKDFIAITRPEGTLALVGQADEEALIDNYLRARMKASGRAGEGFSVFVEYEIGVHVGDSVSLPVVVGVPGLSSRPRFFDLQDELVEEGDFVLRHGLDRLGCRLEVGPASLTAGRQSISWGSGFFWSPTDIFAAFSPTEIDRDEKPGIDALRMETAFGNKVTVDLVFEPLDFQQPYRMGSDDSAAAVRCSGHAGEYDLAVVAGYVAGDAIAGGDFSGYLGNAGLRGDFLYTWVDEAADSDFFRGVLGIDYGLQAAWTPTVAVEYFYNGYGKDEFGEYAEAFLTPSVQRLFTRGTAFGLGRHYIGAMLGVVPSALVSVKSQTAVNVSDGSLREYVSLNWSLLENVDLLLGTNFGVGGSRTEFDRGDLYFTYLKAYF